MFTPDPIILHRYADVLVKYALNSGRGIKKGEVVFLQIPESAKPLLLPLQQSVLESGAHPIIQYLPDNIQKQFFELATDDQLQFFPHHYLRGRVRQADHHLTVIAETDKHELEGIDPLKIMEKKKSQKPYRDWLDTKELRGKFTWTLGLYPTLSMAKEAGIGLKTCWQQLIRACYLDDPNPVAKWRQLQSDQQSIVQKVNRLNIKSLQIRGKNVDLSVGLGQDRLWVGGSGRNIPSFEIFTSPDFHQVDGFVHFDLPLYRDGHLIRDIEIIFKKGIVVSAKASQNQKYLAELIKVPNANRVGEFSLTDKRFSRINRFMAETLYDENFGGRYGNFHLALGASFKECYKFSKNKLTPSDWEKLGFNDSAIHADLISTSPRTVTATLADNSSRAIYHRGQFLI